MRAGRAGRLALGLAVMTHLVVPGAESADGTTPRVFERFGDAVVQVRVVDGSSGTKRSLGSGFYIDERGTIVTNYHVVADLVHHPGRYRAERIDHTGTAAPIDLLAVDVVHDLAVARHAADRPARPVRVAPVPKLTKGTRLYALGNPEDYGLIIVEGTYNGLLDHSFYNRIHFTGSINPGMSGGPAITETGLVVGVNVATAGNQLGFLVPAERLSAVLDDAAAQAEPPDDDALIARVREQLLAHQEVYLGALLGDEPVATVPVESALLPGEMAPFIDCWGDRDDPPEARYVTVSRTCAAEDQILLGEDIYIGVVEYDHQVLVGRDLNRFQLHAAASDSFGDATEAHGTERDFTRFACHEGFVANQGSVLKVAFCLRGYRRMPDLYDVVVRAALLGRPTTVATTHLALWGVGIENARRVVARYLAGMRWSP
jgi:serine protease Do